MGGDSIKTINIEVEIQENGIIRLATNGCLIGRLVDDVEFDDLVVWVDWAKSESDEEEPQIRQTGGDK